MSRGTQREPTRITEKGPSLLGAPLRVMFSIVGWWAGCCWLAGLPFSSVTTKHNFVNTVLCSHCFCFSYFIFSVFVVGERACATAAPPTPGGRRFAPLQQPALRAVTKCGVFAFVLFFLCPRVIHCLFLLLWALSVYIFVFGFWFVWLLCYLFMVQSMVSSSCWFWYICFNVFDVFHWVFCFRSRCGWSKYFYFISFVWALPYHCSLCLCFFRFLFQSNIPCVVYLPLSSIAYVS